MSEVIVKEEIGAPAAVVWEILGDFGGLAKWAEAVSSCEVEGDGIGAVRTLGMPGGLSLQERLEAYDDGARTLSYAIIGDNPLPFSNYLSVIRLDENGADACTLEWRGTFEPKSGAEDTARGIVQNIYASSVKALKKKLGV
jgi:hypothetical protein